MCPIYLKKANSTYLIPKNNFLKWMYAKYHGFTSIYIDIFEYM